MENSYKENEKMRILELLLVLSCISLLVNVWFSKKINRNIRIATICCSIGLFVCQLIFEGYRWQMVFIYFLTFLLMIISFLRLKIKVRFIRGCCHFFAVLLIAVSIFLSLSFPVFNLPEVQIADLEFVLHNLEKINNGAIRSKFEGKLDLNNIGMMGHSFGGATAFNAVATNERIKAGINMDGTLYNMDSIPSSTKPFMFIQPEEFIVQKEEIEKNKVTNTSNMTEEEWNELMNYKRKEFETINQSLASRGVMMSIKGTKHYNFTDFQLFSNLLNLIGYTGSIDGKRGTEIVNKYVVDFFSNHLQGIDGGLKSEQNANYPEVRFHSIEE